MINLPNKSRTFCGTNTQTNILTKETGNEQQLAVCKISTLIFNCYVYFLVTLKYFLECKLKFLSTEKKLRGKYVVYLQLDTRP
jgi:hypothetical protein